MCFLHSSYLAFDLANATVETDQNKIISDLTDVSDISDTTSNNMKIVANPTTDDARFAKMPRRLVNREEQWKLIVQTSGAISIINESNYIDKSTSDNNTYTISATKSGWVCSCPDYARYNSKCKHVYAVEFYRQSATF